ncbi:MAG: FAD-binding protein [Caldilineales bacterium]|nr:FAD-binding protein [Caldilineales bacterium]
MAEATISSLQHDLKRVIPNLEISQRTADLEQHARDQSAYAAVLPDVVVWPESAADVSALLRFANERRIPVVAWGAGTSIEGNPIPVFGGIVMDMGRMNRIVALHERDFQATVQPGIFYKDMNRELGRNGLFFPPDPGANASVGGMLANNASGTRTVKYGSTRDNVLALEVVLANGEVMRTGSRSVKQSSGYDLTHLFIGSEGTLGIITEATLKLYPIPTHFSAATAAFPNVEAASEAVFEIIASGLEPTALELLDETAVEIVTAQTDLILHPGPNLFMEFSSASLAALTETLPIVREICRGYGSVSYRDGVGRNERAALWEARHSVFEAQIRHFPGQNYIVTDVSVPISRYPELIRATHKLLDELQIHGGMVSHAGDGNVHTTAFFAPDDEPGKARALDLSDRLVDLALRMSGTSTGEHGVGLGKQKFMLHEHGETTLGLMRDIKKLFDPNQILNPGKVLDLPPSYPARNP